MTVQNMFESAKNLLYGKHADVLGLLRASVQIV